MYSNSFPHQSSNSTLTTTSGAVFAFPVLTSGRTMSAFYLCPEAVSVWQVPSPQRYWKSLRSIVAKPTSIVVV